MKVDSVIATSPTTTSVPSIEYHPNAPRPGFIWTADLPLAWRLVATHPAQWRTSVDRLADDYLPGVRLRSAHQKLVKHQLEQVVKQSQRAGVLLTLVLPGMVNGEVSAATLLLRWADSAPRPASIISAEKQLEKHGPHVEQTDAGDSYVFASRTAQVGPLTDRRTSYTHQALLPIAGSTHTLVVSGTAPTDEASALVADVVRRCVSSVQTFPDTAHARFFDELAADRAEGASNGGSDTDSAMTMVMTDKGVVK